MPPFEWPHVGARWPAYNVESPLAEGLEAYWPALAGGGGNALRDLAGVSKLLPNTKSVAGANDAELGYVSHFPRAASTRYWKIADNDALSVGDISFEFAAWVKFIVLPESGKLARILGKVDDDGEEYTVYAYGVNATTVYYYFRCRTPDNSSSVSAVNMDNAVVAGKWYLFHGYYDADADQVGLAVCDGSTMVVDTSALAGGVRSAAHPFTIGVCVNWLQASNAYIGDVAFWKHRTLTTEERWRLWRPETRWELHQIPQRLWRLGAIAPPPPTAALPIFSSPDAIHSLVFGGVIVR